MNKHKALKNDYASNDRKEASKSVASMTKSKKKATAQSAKSPMVNRVSTISQELKDDESVNESCNA